MRDNWRPFVLIQICMFAAVFAYYRLPAVGAISDTAAEAKARGGYLFSAVATIFASLVLPELAQRATRTAKRVDIKEIFFRAGFFGLIGVVIDAFYRLLALLFGNSNEIAVIVKKGLVDQLIFAPFVAIPMSAVAFLWRDEGFDARATVRALRNGAFLPRYVPVIITCWGFWFPTLVAVFAMPARLQFVLYLFAQAAWSLLLVHMTGARPPNRDERATA
ncbi:MAG: hypothetical protein ACO1SV_11665 [Fimbriimonas sp.]